MNGVKFDNLHSYDDLGLILSSKVISPPEPKTFYADVKGIDGEIDLTEAITGGVKYNSRLLTLNFSYVAEHTTDILATFSAVQKAIHGKKMNITLDDDPNYHYEGRVQVKDMEYDKIISGLTVECTVDPYKYEVGDDWLWDPFCFDHDVINEGMESVEVSGTETIIVIGIQREYIPKIIVSAPMTVTFEDVTYNLTTGTNKIFGIMITQGENEFTFTGTGTVTIENKGGEL